MYWNHIETRVFLENSPMPVGLGVKCSARVQEVSGSNPGEIRTSINSTVEKLIIICFRTLRVPTLRFGGSFF